MARARRIDGEHAHDPYMVQFDKGLALLSYGLLFISPFGVGLPAMASLALAFAHRLDSHPVVRSHYRFQGQIFWTAAALLAFGVCLIVVGGGMELTTVAGFIQAHMAGLSLPSWLIGAYGDHNERATGNGMLIAGLLAALVAVAWLMLASLWGGFKLLLGRPIGPKR